MELIDGKMVTPEEKKRLLYKAYHSHEEQPLQADDGSFLQKKNVLRIKLNKPHDHQQPNKLNTQHEEEEKEKMMIEKKHLQFLMELEATCCRNSTNKPSSLNDDHHHMKNSMQQHELAQPGPGRGKDERFLINPEYHSHEEQPQQQAAACGGSDDSSSLQKKNIIRIKLNKPRNHQQPKKLAQEDKEHLQFLMDLEATCCRNNTTKPSSLNDDHHHDMIKNTIPQPDSVEPRSTRCGKDERFLNPQYHHQEAKEEDIDDEEEEKKKKQKHVELLKALEATCCTKKPSHDDRDVDNSLQEPQFAQPSSGRGKDECFLPPEYHHQQPKQEDEKQEKMLKRKLEESKKTLIERYKMDAKGRKTIIVIDDAELRKRLPTDAQIRRGRRSFFSGTKTEEY